MELLHNYVDGLALGTAWKTGRAAGLSSTIAVVAHWGVCFSLTGREFENCELVEFELQELEPGKGKMPV